VRFSCLSCANSSSRARSLRCTGSSSFTSDRCASVFQQIGDYSALNLLSSQDLDVVWNEADTGKTGSISAEKMSLGALCLSESLDSLLLSLSAETAKCPKCY
jgi:hypothetical protein